MTTSSTILASMEYLMPQRRQRAAIYVRESDTNLAMDSTTVESATKALLNHAAKNNYDVSPEHVFKEAISGFYVYYFDRPELMKLLKLVEQKRIDIVLVTEIRALSRRGAGEVLTIYSLLQKHNVQLETLAERITDDPMGEVLLTFRATWARIEREQSFLRMQRGKKDRIEIGKAPPNGQRCYGYLLVDTERETRGRYVFNMEPIFVDRFGTKWSEINVRKYILECVLAGKTLHGITHALNDLGIPPPGKPVKGMPCWDATAVRRIAENPINMGMVYVNQYKKVGKSMMKRPKEDWILLPPGTAPALIDEDTYAEIMKRISWNKEESLRNNQHKEELGLLRCGHITCGICKRKMATKFVSEQSKRNPVYCCYHKQGKNLDVIHNHRTTIGMHGLDAAIKEKIMEVVSQPNAVREKVAQIRQENKPVVSEQEVHDTIIGIQQKMRNLYKFAENAPDDEELARLTERMQELGRQKREAEAMLHVLEDDAEERAAIEKELQRFEKWVLGVQENYTDAAYMQTASYQELRLAVKILGIRATVYPGTGEYPYRYRIEVMIPELLAKLSVAGQSSS